MNESKTVVGIDESEGLQRALQWALEETVLRRADVELVHVVAPVHGYYPYWLHEVQPIESRDAEESVRQMLASALAKAGGEPPGISVELAPRIGLAPNVLLEESHDAALLVVPPER